MKILEYNKRDVVNSMISRLKSKKIDHDEGEHDQAILEALYLCRDGDASGAKKAFEPSVLALETESLLNRIPAHVLGSGDIYCVDAEKYIYPLITLGEIYYLICDYDSSEQRLKEAEEFLRKIIDKSDINQYRLDLSHCCQMLGNVYLCTDRMDESETMYREAADMDLRLADEIDADIPKFAAAESVLKLAGFKLYSGRNEDARELCREAYMTISRIESDDYRFSYSLEAADLFCIIAEAYEAEEKPFEAETAFTEAVNILEDIPEKQEWLEVHMAATYHKMGDLLQNALYKTYPYKNIDKEAEARSELYYRKALKIFEKHKERF